MTQAPSLGDHITCTAAVALPQVCRHELTVKKFVEFDNSALVLNASPSSLPNSEQVLDKPASVWKDFFLYWYRRYKQQQPNKTPTLRLSSFS